MNINFPPRDVSNSVIDILEQKGIRIPQEYVDMTLAVMCHWLKHEERGHEYMCHLLGLEAVKGKSEFKYLFNSAMSPYPEEILPEKIVFLRGCVAKGSVLPVNRIDIIKREKEECQSCMGSYSCVERNKTSTCSHCSGFSEYKEDQYECGITCQDCTDTSCSWHPVNADNPSAIAHYH